MKIKAIGLAGFLLVCGCTPASVNVMRQADLKMIWAEVNPNERLHVSDEFNKRSGQNLRKEINGTLLFSGLPENSYAKPVRLSSRFKSDEFSHNSYRYVDRLSCRDFESNPNVLESAIAPLKLVRRESHISNMTTLMDIDVDDYMKHRDKSGAFSSDVVFDVYRYCPVALIPLKSGETYRDGGRSFIINSVRQVGDGCLVQLKEQFFTTFFTKRRTLDYGKVYFYLLVNSEQGIAFRQKDDHMLFYSLKNTDNDVLTAKQRDLQFSSDDIISSENIINEEWLRDAELMIVQVQWMGRSETTVEEESFYFGDSSVLKADRIDPRIPDHGNKDVLSEVTLPENATRDEIKTYIQKIHNISSAQSGVSWRDPQVELLAKIGPENLDLLIPFARRGSSRYEATVIQMLARPEHKALILENLHDIPALSEVVLKFGWQVDAREILLEALKDPDDDGFVDMSTIRAVATLKDPKTYPMLINYFIYGMNKSHTYAAIKDLPGINLAYAFPKAWKNAQDSSFELQRLIAPALDFGLEDALGAIVEYLHKEPISDYWRDLFHTSFQKHTGVSGTRETLCEWYLSNKGALGFDPETKMFMVE